MDAMTERAWEEEFARQYPDTRWTPPSSAGKLEADALTRLAREGALRAKYGWIDHFPPSPFYAGMCIQLNENTAKFSSNQMKFEELRAQFVLNSHPYTVWKSDCKARFNSIFQAEPVYALEQLKRGNLFIEHAPADSDCNK